MAQLPCIGLSWPLTNRHLLRVAIAILLSPKSVRPRQRFLRPGSKICKRSIFFCSMAWLDLCWSTFLKGACRLSPASKIYIIYIYHICILYLYNSLYIPKLPGCACIFKLPCTSLSNILPIPPNSFDRLLFWHAGNQTSHARAISETSSSPMKS